MLRSTLTIAFLFACSLVASAAETTAAEAKLLPVPAQKAGKAVKAVLDSVASDSVAAAAGQVGKARTLAEPDAKSKLVPAVHVDSNGVDSNYGGATASEAVNRLRSARKSDFLPPSTKRPANLKVTPALTNAAENVKGTNKAIESFLGGTTSRRRKPETTKPAATATSKTADTQTAEKKPAADLPSVMARQAPTSEPTVASEVKAVPRQPKVPTPASPKVPVAQSQSTMKLAPISVAAKPDVEEAIKPSQFDASPVRTDVPFTNVNASPLRKPPASNTIEVETGHTAVSIPSGSNQITTGQPRIADPTTTTLSPSTTTTTPVRKPAKKEDDVLLSNRSPMLVVKTHGQSTIRVGRMATYYVTAANIGDLSAEDVNVTVNVPNWAEITRNQATSGMVRIEPSTTGDNLLRWSIRDLRSKNQQRLRLDLVPRASRPIELGVSWNFKSLSAVAQIEVQEPKLQLAVTGPGDVRYGETKLYTITISNPGTGDAENVMLTLLPIHEGTGSAGTREIGTIKAGTRRSIEVELTARQAGEIAVRAAATADGGLQVEGRQDVRVRRPTLAVEALGPAKRYAGTTARYTIKVSNTGDATAQNVVAVAALPMASEFVKCSNAGIHDKERGRVRWSIGSLRPGAFQIVEVTTTLKGSGSNRLDVRTAAAEQLTAAGSVVTEVESIADLRMTVLDPAGVVPLDTEMTYEVHIVNRGTRAANNVDVVGYFSEGIEPVAVRGWRANVQVGQVVMDTIPRISPGQEMVVKVIAKASRPGNHVFRTELASKDPQTKLAVEEWTVFHRDDAGTEAPVQQAGKETTSVR